MTLNVGEYGTEVYVNMGQDVSGAIEYKIVLQPQIGDELIKTATLGTTNITYNGQTLESNKYLVYTIGVDDLDRSGWWRKRGKAKMSASQEVVSNFERFTVLD